VNKLSTVDRTGLALFLVANITWVAGVLTETMPLVVVGLAFSGGSLELARGLQEIALTMNPRAQNVADPGTAPGALPGACDVRPWNNLRILALAYGVAAFVAAVLEAWHLSKI
jgi:hypothetical protein